MLKTVQCKDIPTQPILELLASKKKMWPISKVEAAMPVWTPKNLVRAKLKTLVKNGLIDGCCCGCRGDFEIKDKGRLYLSTRELI